MAKEGNLTRDETPPPMYDLKFLWYRLDRRNCALGKIFAYAFNAKIGIVLMDSKIERRQGYELSSGFASWAVRIRHSVDTAIIHFNTD